MASFTGSPSTGSPSDLADAVAYELNAIEYVRGTLHGQSEHPAGRTTLMLDDMTPDGELRRTVSVGMHTSMSEDAVRAALNVFRPLAFSASFKLQDMIVEWILRANGVVEWRFSKKLSAYDSLSAAGTLIHPSFFAARPLLAGAFWELYRFLVPFRGSVVLGWREIEADGTVSIVRGNGFLAQDRIVHST
jgi:hypothetical protein